MPRIVQTPRLFLYAARWGHTEIVKALLAAPNIDVKGLIPLHWSAENGHLEVVRALIEAGADVNARAENGLIPLILSAQNGHLEVVRALIEAGAYVNAKDRSDTTPLLMPRDGDTKIVKALLAAPNIDVNAEDHSDTTPLFLMSCGRDDTKIVKVCSQHQILTSMPRIVVHHASFLMPRDGDTQKSSRLCSQHQILMSMPRIVQTPHLLLDKPRGWGHTEIVKALLAAPNIDVNAKDRSDTTPLSHAARWGHTEIVKALLAAPTLMMPRIVQTPHPGFRV